MDEQGNLSPALAAASNGHSNSDRSRNILGDYGPAISTDNGSRDFPVSPWSLQRPTHLHQTRLLKRRGRSQKERAMRYRLLTHAVLMLLASSYIAIGIADSSSACNAAVWIPYIVIALWMTIINLRRENRDRIR
jgi:hypothetical protein